VVEVTKRFQRRRQPPTQRRPQRSAPWGALRLMGRHRRRRRPSARSRRPFGDSPAAGNARLRGKGLPRRHV